MESTYQYYYNVPYLVPETTSYASMNSAARTPAQSLFIPPPPQPRPPHSCFAPGTPVWTATGATAIEKILPGDRVLSQDPETGELTYKPVLKVTLRSARPMLDLTVGDETIRSTRGHLFWVAGEGWLMAREMVAGQKLQAIGEILTLTKPSLPIPNLLTI